VADADALDRLRRFLSEGLWRRERARSGAAGLALGTLELAVLVGEGFVRDRCLMRATALAWVTALSLIPLLAIAVSVLGAFGVREDVASFLVKQVAAGSPAAEEWILRLLAGVNLSGLGTLGGAVLFATTVLTVGSVEGAFNDIFGVRRQREWIRRIPDYLAVVVVAPLLLGVALSLGTLLRSQWLVQRLLSLPEAFGLEQRLPVLALYALGFAFLYWFLPNTEVRGRSALLGGTVAALLFDAAQAAYLGFNVGAARSNALFGTFAFLPLFLIWIHVCWTIVLLGAEVTFAHQHLPWHRREVLAGARGTAARESLGLALALHVARAFEERGEACRDLELAHRVEAPLRLVRELLAELERAGLLAPRGDGEREGWVQLARPAARIRVADVRAALRGPAAEPPPDAAARLAAAVGSELDAAAAQGAGSRTLAELLGEL
jgi:membrane protein